jgi:hypothetical protein
MKRTILKSGAPPPDASWSFALPDKLRLAIADAIIVFARMETTLLEIVWILEESNLEEKQVLVRDVVSKNFKKLKKVVTGLPGAETGRIWPTLEKLANERNLIAHGFWAVDDKHDDRPVVMSHKFLESEDYVTGEHFDYARFDSFMKRAEHLLNTFRQFRVMLDGLSREQRIAAGLILPKKKKSRWQRLVSVLRRRVCGRP